MRRAHRPTRRLRTANVIKAGEFLLGYLNEYGVLPDPLDLPGGDRPAGLLPTVTTAEERPVRLTWDTTGRTWWSARLRQYVPELWNYLDQATKDAAGQSRPAEREKLASKLIGRWPSGAPMARCSRSRRPGASRTTMTSSTRHTDPAVLAARSARTSAGQPARHAG